jgi:hypothetical protein
MDKTHMSMPSDERGRTVQGLHDYGQGLLAEDEARYEYNLTHFEYYIEVSQPVDGGLEQAQGEVAADSNNENAGLVSTNDGNSEITVQTQNPWQSLRFADLWKNHPSNGPERLPLVPSYNRDCPCAESNGNCTYANECAVRLSAALQKSGIDMSSYRGVKCGSSGYAVRGHELALWMSGAGRLGKPQVFKDGNEALKQLGGVTGIVYIRQFKGVDQPNIRWDHIDVWNGRNFAHGATQYFSGSPSYVWFWPIK